jgi:uncharacterized lipoprotein YajG
MFLKKEFLFLPMLILGGCASNEKILINTYSKPVESKKVETMIGESEKRGGKYLSISINPKIENIGQNRDLASLLIDGIKEKITETNFIYINPIYDDAKLSLNMSIVEYDFQQSKNEINANLSVSFNILRGFSNLYTKTYRVSDSRYSKSAQGLPSKQEIVLSLSKEISKKFIKDISPLKSNSLREILEFPDGLEYLLNYAKAKNYSGAIKAMENFSGKKDINFYYNLALFYEAFAGEKENFAFLKRASENYEKSLSLGGFENEIIVKAKADFDNFYKIFKSIDEQRENNLKIEKEINEELGL